MKRPFLLRCLPWRVRASVYYRLFQNRHQEFEPLFECAPLALAPEVSMHGLLPGDAISGCIAFNGFYELPLSRKIFGLGRQGGLFVDVGANMGYYALLWLAANSQSRVVCFEASPRNLTTLETNINNNGFAQRTKIEGKAASKENGVIAFDIGPEEQTGWGGITIDRSAKSIEVPMIRLDTALPETLIDVLKIDVEGADTWVVMGCEQLLREKRIKHIFFEQNTQRMEMLGISPSEARDFLADYGYRCIPIDAAQGEWFAYPTAADD